MKSITALSNRQVMRAALVVLFGFLASGALGLIRQAVISSTFGASAVLDSFSAAQRIPEMLFVLVAGGALGSAFIPIFSRYLQADQAAAWRLASAIVSLALLAAVLLSAVMAAFAPQLVANTLTRDAAPELQALTVDLTRIMLLTVPIFSISGLLMGILNAHQSFTWPALAASMYNVGQIFGAAVLARVLPALVVQGEPFANVYGLAWGAVIGAALHLLVQLPGLLRLPLRGLRFLPSFSVPGARAVLLLMGPRVLGLAVVQINFLVNVALAYPPRMITGSVTVFSYAWQLMFFVLGIVGQSVGTALFPSLSALAAAGDMDGYKQRLASALRGVLFLALPASVGLVVLGEPLVRVLFERGAWTAIDSQGTAWALTFLALGVSGHALLEVLSRAFYALEDTRTPVLVGIGAMVANIIFSLLLVRMVGDPFDLARGAFAGLALANSVTTLVEAAILWWILRQRTQGLHDADTLGSAARTALAAVVMGVVAWALDRALLNAGVWMRLLGGAALGAGVFFALAFVLRVKEARILPQLALQRLRR